MAANPKKRPLTESTMPDAGSVVVDGSQAPAAEPEAKKARIPEPVQPAQQVVRSPYILYPDQYETFDPKKIAFAATAQASREGSGQLLWMSYVYPDGQTRPFLIHSPRAMHSPLGVKLWKDGKSSVLLSLGRDYEADPTLIKFRQICDAIQHRAAEVAVEKEWMGAKDLQATEKQFSPIAFVGSNEKTGEPYPPTVKATVIVTGKDKTEFFEFSPTPPLKTLLPGDLEGACSITAVLHFAWVFAKKAKKGTEFSIRCTLFQAIIESSGGTSAARNGCAVMI